MTRRWPDINVTPGSLSSERLPATMTPRRFLLRPDSLAEKFAAAGTRLGAADVRLARESRDAGPWARLFQAEPAYLYAEILSFRAADAGFAFSEALERHPDAAQQQLLALAHLLDGWIKRIHLDAPVPFSKQLDQLDKEANLTALLSQLTASGPAALMRMAESHATVRTAETTGGVLAKARATRERLRSLHALLRNAVTSLQASAQAAFDARLKSGTIDPGLGLLIAELRTAAHVDAAINQVVERHTTLYYTDIIGQTPAAPSREMVLLDLGTVPRTGFLPQGATLDARLDDGTIQRFETEAGVPISPARVSDVRLLSYATNDDISYNRALGGITGLRAAALDPAASVRDSGTLFDTGRDVPAEIGLDIASPMLSLAEGTRRIEMSLHMSRSSSLPAESRPLTSDEIKARAARRRALGRPTDPPDLRRDIATLPGYADPDVRLALSADPVLTAAFSGQKQEIAVETLTYEITEFAEQSDRTPSLGLVYEYLMDQVERPEQLRLLLGRIVTLSLIEQHPFPSGAYWEKIFALVDRYREDLVGKTPLDASEAALTQNSMIFSAFSQRPDGTIDYPPEDVFQSLLGDAFSVTITTDAGPRAPDIMQAIPVRQKRAAGGITLSLRYDSSAPALTGPDSAPTLALRYATDARLCPLSFFEAYSIDTITLRTQVTGLRRLAAFSDDGPLSTDQTFQPFGPRPEEGATFLVGCAEMARKPVTAISIALDWSRMPNPVGGFESHYEAYGRNIDIPAPELTIDYLSGDGWKPVSETPQPLFQSEGITGALLPHWQFTGKVSGHSVPAQGKVSAQEYQSRQTIRAGLVRMRLSGTGGGFLAAQYPMALVDAMRPRLLPRATPRKLPPAPFVPEVSQFILSYTAEATIELNAPDTARPGEMVRQISPFGSVGLFPIRQVKDTRLFPKRLGYGEIAFQLTGPNVTGPTALTISVAPSGHLRRVPRPNPVKWVYLAEHGWQPLPDTAIASDTTAGLMRSGIVIFDLPEDAAAGSSLMPSGGVWIAAIATRPNLEVFPAITGASINGVWVRRLDDTWKATEAARRWAFNPAQPGLTDLTEIPTPNRTRPPEPRETFVARIGERLRHSHRAVTPWDMERMVLEEFPEVWMAKCLPHLSQDSPAPAPGHATLVVCRDMPRAQVERAPAPALFDVATLERIRGWVSRYCSETAQVDVVNPTFERLQVRAKIAVGAERENGAMAQMLRRDLARGLSVWTAEPALRRFGWSLNVHMLRAYVEDLDYVRGVTDFSVLHLVGDDTRTYQLLDTAQDRRDPRGRYGPVLHPRFPWSLPLSTRDHVLSILQDLNDETPTAAGIGSLSLGDMLIVGQRTHP
ncbi:MAG: hypothetical protein AAF999_14100 [Pseudomonadota bacterium]